MKNKHYTIEKGDDVDNYDKNNDGVINIKIILMMKISLYLLKRNCSRICSFGPKVILMGDVCPNDGKNIYRRIDVTWMEGFSGHHYTALLSGMSMSIISKLNLY